MPTHLARGHATRTRVRARVEHAFAAQKCCFHLIVRTIGMVRARAKIGMANLVFNFTCLAQEANCVSMTPKPEADAAGKLQMTGASATQKAVLNPPSGPALLKNRQSEMSTRFQARPGLGQKEKPLPTAANGCPGFSKPTSGGASPAQSHR